MRFWIFEVEIYDINKWKKEFFFYCLSNVLLDLKTDWRFKWVQEKRGKGKLIGTVDNPIFPIQYPIMTNEGKEIFKRGRLFKSKLDSKKPKSKKLAENSDFKVERPQIIKKSKTNGIGDFANFKVA